VAATNASLFDAEFRRGLKDLQNAVLNPFPPSAVATHEDLGTIGNPTPMQVSRSIDGKASFQDMLNDYASRSAPITEPQLER
jgi:hypothetical protein